MLLHADGVFRLFLPEYRNHNTHNKQAASTHAWYACICRFWWATPAEIAKTEWKNETKIFDNETYFNVGVCACQRIIPVCICFYMHTCRIPV